MSKFIRNIFYWWKQVKINQYLNFDTNKTLIRASVNVTDDNDFFNYIIPIIFSLIVILEKKVSTYIWIFRSHCTCNDVKNLIKK